MSDGGLHSFWSSLQRAEQRMEAEAKATERDLYRTVYGYKSRVMRLRSALAKSGPIAFQTVSRKLEGIDLKVIWPILFSAVRDMALYYGGSVVLGTAVGAGLGSLAFGFGAIPGAAIGAEAGSVVGDWVLIYLGLQMLAEGLVNTIPPALRLYVQGFRLAWGPVDSDRPDARYSADYHQGEDMAAHRFADGHVLMIIAILMAMVAYLTRGKSEEALMQAVRKSERLGTKMADWLADNRERLLKEESLKPKVVERASSQEKEADPLRKRNVGGPRKDSEAATRVVHLQTRSAEVVNNEMIAAGNQPAWMPNTNVVTQVVPTGTRYQMVVSEAQAQALAQGEPWFGGWATPDAVPSQAFARNDLAILPEFKPDVSYVVTVETTAPQTVNAGFAGPLGDLGGGGSQVEFVGQRNLQLVGQPQSLPE